MTNRLLYGLILAGTLALGACTTTGARSNITVDSDPAQNFSSYSKFAWASENPVMTVGDYAVSPLKQKEISDAIKSNLQGCGYVYVTDITTADFAVSYTVGARDKISTRTYTSYPNYFFDNRASWGWGGGYFGRPVPIRLARPVNQTVTQRYTEGTLTIDIFDVAKKSPVWHASMSKRLSAKQLRSGDQDSVAEGVQALFSRFPPQR